MCVCIYFEENRPDHPIKIKKRDTQYLHTYIT